MATDTPTGAQTPRPVDAEPPVAPTQTPATQQPSEINVADHPELDQPTGFGQAVSADGVGGISEITFEEKAYNADESRDATRQTITLWLLGLLCAIVALSFVALFARGASTGFTDKAFFSELKQVLDVLVGPVITLLASAVGFYFGYKQGPNVKFIQEPNERSPNGCRTEGH